MSTPRYAYRLGWRSLKTVCPSLTAAQAKTLARELGQAMHDFDCTTPQRAAMCVAQLAHESGEFRYREEIASGAAYEGRRDLGNVHAGDGVRYKGRGYLQITGRVNYLEVSRALGVDFVHRSTKLADPHWACQASLWWWKQHGCNQLADTGNLVTVTRRINGGVNGLEDRRKYYRRARVVQRFLVPKRRKP